MAAETQYTAKTGMVEISTANSNLDGTGTLGNVLTAGANGTLIKTVTIKATGNTTQGIVRLFISDGTNTRLLQEIDVPTMTASATDPSFEAHLILNYVLESGYTLKASTQLANTFNIIAEGLDYAYYSSSVRPESTNYTANTGVGFINTANSNLDGSGTLGTILTVGSSGSGWKGSSINAINIKAQSAVSHGMVRIYVQNTGTGAANTFLLTEVFIPYTTPSGTFRSLHRQIIFPKKLQIEAGFKILASTQNADSFSVIADAMDWKYPS